jgi:hypothetical protein
MTNGYNLHLHCSNVKGHNVAKFVYTLWRVHFWLFLWMIVLPQYVISSCNTTWPQFAHMCTAGHGCCLQWYGATAYDKLTELAQTQHHGVHKKLSHETAESSPPIVTIATFIIIQKVMTLYTPATYTHTFTW